MIDWAAWAAMAGIGTLFLSFVAMIGKYFFDKGTFEAEMSALKENAVDKEVVEHRLSVLESQEERLWGMDFLTRESHEKQATSCRDEIYKDMSRLENNMKDLIERLVVLEEKREEKDEKTNERLREMHEAIVEIRTFLKVREEKPEHHSIGVY